MKERILEAARKEFIEKGFSDASMRNLDLAGVYTALLRIIGKCVDLANEILDIPQMDIDGEDITPANRDIHLEHVSFAYENRRIIENGAPCRSLPEESCRMEDCIACCYLE